MGKNTLRINNRKGQEKILVDFSAIIVFVIVAIVFWAIFKSMTSSRADIVADTNPVHYTHLALLQFTKSTVNAQPITDILPNANENELTPIIEGYFSKYGFIGGWECTIAYSDGRENNIKIGPGREPPSISRSYIPVVPLIVSMPLRDIVAKQIIPAQDGSIITIQLETWWY